MTVKRQKKIPNTAAAITNHRKMPSREQGRVQVCPVTKALNFIGKSYTLQILHRLYHSSPMRFSELRDLLGISPKVLTSRLQEMCEFDIATRRSHDEIPPRVEYGLSPKGKDLILCIPVDLSGSTVTFPARPGKMFDELQSWSEKYDFAGLKAKK